MKWSAGSAARITFCSLFTAIVFLSSAKAVDANIDDKSSNVIVNPISQSQLQIDKRKKFSDKVKSPYTLLFPSAVVHGFQPDTDSAAAMPRRISGNGQAVWTPGLGLQYTNPNGSLVLGALLKDCFNNPAGTLQFGHEYSINRKTQWAWSAGLYVRQTPLDCSQRGPYQGCQLLDFMSSNFVYSVKGQLIDIIPLPFLHWKQTIFENQKMKLNLSILANGLLNEVGFEIPL